MNSIFLTYVTESTQPPTLIQFSWLSTLSPSHPFHGQCMSGEDYVCYGNSVGMGFNSEIVSECQCPKDQLLVFYLFPPHHHILHPGLVFQLCLYGGIH